MFNFKNALPRMRHTFLWPGAALLHFFCAITPGEQFKWNDYFNPQKKEEIPSMTPWFAVVFWIILILVIFN